MIGEAQDSARGGTGTVVVGDPFGGKIFEGDRTVAFAEPIPLSFSTIGTCE